MAKLDPRICKVGEDELVSEAQMATAGGSRAERALVGRRLNPSPMWRAMAQDYSRVESIRRKVYKNFSKFSNIKRVLDDMDPAWLDKIACLVPDDRLPLNPTPFDDFYESSLPKWVCPMSV